MKKEMSNEVQRDEIDVNMTLELFRKHLGWIIALITAIISSFMAFFAFLDYVEGLTISNYYGFDISFYQSTGIYFILKAFLGAICCYLILFLLYKKKKVKLFSIYNVVFYLFIIVLNLILSIFYFSYINISTLINAIVFFVFELVLFKFFVPYYIKNLDQIDKKVDGDINYSLVKAIKVIIISFFLDIIVFAVCIVISTQLSLWSLKNYSMIDENRVIVHATSEYYVVLDCDVSDGGLKLYQGKYEIIPVVNVHSEKVKFNSAQIKKFDK